ncbi:hypothetical protein VPH35_010315 [Triticum aestivum]
MGALCYQAAAEPWSGRDHFLHHRRRRHRLSGSARGSTSTRPGATARGGTPSSSASPSSSSPPRRRRHLSGVGQGLDISPPPARRRRPPSVRALAAPALAPHNLRTMAVFFPDYGHTRLRQWPYNACTLALLVH